MRGIAAIAVILYHLPNLTGSALFTRGYLAVDFFFMLSGFVIARHYEDRLRQGALRAGSYMWKRVVRLYPLAFLSLTVALSMRLASGKELPAGWALSFLFIPSIFGSLAYPLNNPLWSLALELLINAVHAILAPMLTSARLAVVIAGSAAALVVTAFSAGGLNVGWSMASDQTAAMWFGGLARVSFGFFAGVALCRLHDARWFPQIRGGCWIAYAGLAAALLLPVPISPLSDSAYPLLLFPTLIIAGLSPEPSRRVEALAIWAGAISYPLYALHYPMLRLFVVLQPHITRTGLHPAAVYTGVTASLLVLAHLANRYFDAPASRKVWMNAPAYLRARLTQTRANQPAPAATQAPSA